MHHESLEYNKDLISKMHREYLKCTENFQYISRTSEKCTENFGNVHGESSKCNAKFLKMPLEYPKYAVCTWEFLTCMPRISET